MNLKYAQELVSNYTPEGQARALAMFTDDAIFADKTLGFTVKGQEQLIGLFADFFNPANFEHSFTVLTYAGDAHQGAFEWTWKVLCKGEFMGQPAAGKELNIPGVTVLTFRDGKIASLHDYWDGATALRQLGAI